MLELDSIKSYSINLMWINKNLDTDQTYIYGNNKDKLITTLLTPGIKWAAANPEAKVIIWYDSLFTTKEAIQNTQNVLNDLSIQRKSFNLMLRDISEIPIVKDNPDVFSENLPIYFRVDLLKPIFLIYSIEVEKMDAAIFSDLEVGDLFYTSSDAHIQRMTKMELFTPEVMAKLERSKLLVNGYYIHDYYYEKYDERMENQFFQLIADQQMVEIIKNLLINVNLERAIAILNISSSNKFSKDMSDALFGTLTTVVYEPSLRDLLKYHRGLTSNEPTMVRTDYVKDEDNNKEKWVVYEPRKHGYRPLGLFLYYVYPKSISVRICSMNVSEQEKENWCHGIERSNIITFCYNSNKYRQEDCFLNLKYVTRRDLGVRSGHNHREMAPLYYKPPAFNGVYSYKYWEQTEIIPDQLNIAAIKTNETLITKNPSHQDVSTSGYRIKSIGLNLIHIF